MRIGSAPTTALILLAAAALEVGGDAAIRAGLRGRGFGRVALGVGLLAAYGLAVNLVPRDFSRLLGGYVAAFAVVAVLAGRLLFGDALPPATWIGLALIVLGGFVIQLGPG